MHTNLSVATPSIRALLLACLRQAICARKGPRWSVHDTIRLHLFLGSSISSKIAGARSTRLTMFTNQKIKHDKLDIMLPHSVKRLLLKERTAFTSASSPLKTTILTLFPGQANAAVCSSAAGYVNHLPDLTSYNHNTV